MIQSDNLLPLGNIYSMSAILIFNDVGAIRVQKFSSDSSLSVTALLVLDHTEQCLSPFCYSLKGDVRVLFNYPLEKKKWISIYTEKYNF